MIERSETLSPREWSEHNNAKEILEMQLDHAKAIKAMDVEVAKLEAKWSSWLTIPVTIITLPVRVLSLLPLTVYAITRQDVPEFYHRLFK